MRLAAAIPAVALLLAPQPVQAVEREFSRKGVRIQSDDGNFGLRLRGRAHLDAILADSGTVMGGVYREPLPGDDDETGNGTRPGRRHAARCSAPEAGTQSTVRKSRGSKSIH